MRLLQHVTLETSANGDVAVAFDGRSLGIAKLSPKAAECARGLRAGVPLRFFAAAKSGADQEVHMLVRRLAARGLLEYRLAQSRGGADHVV
ncbi:MAG: dehydrogenase, partial [Xanthobacteraceae bacterium]